MKTHPRLFTLVLVIALLAGCAPDPTAMPTATATPLSTATSVPTSTPTPLPTQTATPEATATPIIVFQIDNSLYLIQADQIPTAEQVLWNEANASYQSFFGEEAVKVAYSNMFDGIVALGPEGTIRGYFNQGDDMILGVEDEGWIKAFGGGQLLMITNDPAKTRYDFLDSYGKLQSSAKAIEELNLIMRAELGVLMFKNNESSVVVVPEGISDWNNYVKGSEFIRQNIDTLPKQYLPLGDNNQMNGLEQPVIMVSDNDIEGEDVRMIGNSVVYRLGIIKPHFEGQLVVTDSGGVYIGIFSLINENITGSTDRFLGYLDKILNRVSYKKNSKFESRFVIVVK